ncbi:VTC domain-containing protein [Suillus discolor]|uniref:VTC domain-containing protein n=1 Tax=Suillus discolor TaxID=1912936 RepID=A0A9P7FD33_9AGAM|nr:VTC domain-containing protein [Suillus discolor]KAG2114592.1 VTC domain-containing protein [Suillus discolor]
MATTPTFTQSPAFPDLWVAKTLLNGLVYGTCRFRTPPANPELDIPPHAYPNTHLLLPPAHGGIIKLSYQDKDFHPQSYSSGGGSPQLSLPTMMTPCENRAARMSPSQAVAQTLFVVALLGGGDIVLCNVPTQKSRHPHLWFSTYGLTFLRYSNTLPAPLIYLTKADGVHPDNLVPLKQSFCDIYPYLCSTFNAENEFEQKDAAIYFDNEDLEVHLGQLEKTEVAEAIHLRWYGNMDVKIIFVEHKTLRKDWTGDKSIKARFPIKEHLVNAFLCGEYTMDTELQALVDKCKKTQAKVNSMISSQAKFSIGFL